MTNKTPLVSVLITTYKRPELLRRAITSVMNQDYLNIEIIVSDDASHDDTESVVNEFCDMAKFPIFFISSEHNKGACFCRNRALKVANGYFVTGLDDDDEFTNNRISLLVRNYDERYSLITTNTSVISKQGIKKLFNSTEDLILSYTDSLWENVIGTQVLVRKDRILNCGGFDVNLTSAQDADMWLRLMKKYGSALRLKDATYILHTEHDAPRISTSDNKINGLRYFHSKYTFDMSKSQICYSNFKLSLWENNNKLKFSLLFKLDFKSFCFILKKMIRGKV